MPPRTTTPAAADASPRERKVRQRLSTQEREQQILKGAIKFFSERGLEGQTRDLAKDIGITHPLLYHYFPTKQALIERVYEEVYLGRWKREWEICLDEKNAGLEDKLTRFYLDYAQTILTPEWVRIFVFSGLNDGYIPDRYMALLRQKLFPRIIQETRRHLGLSLRSKASERENEHAWGLHGGIFYIGIRRWVYNQPAPEDQAQVIKDRIRAYIIAAEALFGAAE
jgi:AcrR family transcriptional regulator